MRMRSVILPSAVCHVVHDFSTLSHKQHDFRKKRVIETKMCVLILSITSSEIFIILKINERDMIKNVYWSSCKYPLLFSDFNGTWIFSIGFRKNTPISDFMKISQVGAEMFYADGRKVAQTDIARLLVAFRNFANATKNAHSNKV